MRETTRMLLWTTALSCALLLATPLAARPPERSVPALTISGYVIDAEIDPATHHLAATAVVSFTAPENAVPEDGGAGKAESVSFSLNPALKVAAISDEAGHPLASERTAGGILRVTPIAPFVPGQLVHWSFEYEGTLTGNENGPVEGLKPAARDAATEAAIGEPVTWLLDGARWFPAFVASLPGSWTDRFTAEMRVRVPQGMQVFASGSQSPPTPVTLATGRPGDEYDFLWAKPGFPGAVIAGRFVGPFTAASGNVKVYLTASQQQSGNDLAQAAEREYSFFATSFGAPPSSRLNVLELSDWALPDWALPGGAPPEVWAPELAAIPGAIPDSTVDSMVGEKSGLRLLAGTIARQWWGSEVSPRSLDDAWITNGMDRYSELMAVENQSGASAFKAAIDKTAAGALAHDTIPLSSAGRLNPLSPEFQAMTFDKGAMVFHMLRWEVGDKAFLATLKAALRQYSGGSVGTADFEKLAESVSGQSLTAFFAQWVDRTGAPQFTNDYAVYRLGNNQGFRVTGVIGQNPDAFRLPVELSVETEGRTETERIEVMSARTPYQLDTFGRPRRIAIDPDDWVLKSSPQTGATGP
jgi:hypothetical protein